MITKKCKICDKTFNTLDLRVSMCPDCYHNLDSQDKYEDECEEREDNLRHDYEETHNE